VHALKRGERVAMMPTATDAAAEGGMDRFFGLKG